MSTNKKDKERLFVMEAIADIRIKNYLAYGALIAFLAVTAKIVIDTSHWEEQAALGVLDTVILMVFRYYFPRSGKKMSS